MCNIHNLHIKKTRSSGACLEKTLRQPEHIDRVGRYIDNYNECLESCMSRDLNELAILHDTSKRAIDYKTQFRPQSIVVYPLFLPSDSSKWQDFTEGVSHIENFAHSVPFGYHGPIWRTFEQSMNGTLPKRGRG